MHSARWLEVVALYHAALECKGSARDQLLEQCCATDPALRRGVESLLRDAALLRGFLEMPTAELVVDTTALDRTAGGSAPTDRTRELPLPAHAAQEPFPGTRRFRVVRRLGSGGMGVVYEVHDAVRDELVALKTLRRTGAADFYRLKREFRGLADVTHPNLVCLYELIVEDERCFFTMELVKGVSFIEYLRGTDRRQRFDDRIAPALQQLIAGVSALHQQGKLHRDIKPSNILVTPDGRVVILDFGLIAELLPHRAADRVFVGGTPAYMAPEEALGATPSEAGDWYSVGVTLYEALTGALPFGGSMPDLLLRKCTSDPLAPADIANVSANMSAVCMGLLSRSPAQRLSGREALRRLVQDLAPPVLENSPAPARDTPFVGRRHQLHVLNDAFDAVRSARPAVVSVHGPSGIGKSALVQRFLRLTGEEAHAVVLSGRCYENESLPYKALDGVVDDLSGYLRSVSRQHVEDLMPRDVPALARVFPVLLQVDAVRRKHRDQEQVTENLTDLRRRAFEALRELLRRLADRQPLVIWIDDLQWADEDSVVLLEELLRPPGQPAMLTLLCFRSEEEAAKPFLQALLDREGDDVRSAISLDPITEDEAHALIRALLPDDSALTEHERRRMTFEAGGSPFVLEQLARYASVHVEARGQGPTFSAMFDARLGALSADARRFLETLAICGRPMSPDIICDACGITRERQSLVMMLRSSRFIRSSGSSEWVETYHDRIRQELAAQVAPDLLRRIHGLMVQALLHRRSDDCEALFEHYRGTGDSDNASRQAALAAEKASAALGFDRAAFFYRTALALTPASPSAQAMSEGLAAALANAGRPVEAAEAYLRAASGAAHPRRVELQRRGAEQFLIAGDIDRGRDLIRNVLDSIGVRVPRDSRVALPWLLWRRFLLRWRGLDFVSRRAEDIDADLLLRVDTCWSATAGLLFVDAISAGEFCVRGLLLALEAGEPSRIARVMAIEAAANHAFPTGRTFAERLARVSKTLARDVGSPYATALSILGESLTAMAAGEWKRAGSLAEQALEIFRDRCTGVTWELNIAHNLVIWALMYRGELREVSRQVPLLLVSARRTGNSYIATELCTRSNYVWLAADEPDQGEREAIDSIERWSHKGFHRQHYSALLARVQTALYRGDAEAAWRQFTEQESLIRSSLLTQIQVFRIETHYMRARSALAMAASGRSPHRFLAIARAGARRIAHERAAWSQPLALLLKAGAAYLDGDASSVLAYLHEAAERATRADMNLYAAVARRRIGAVQSDAQGRELQREAEAWMAAQQIKNPVAMTRMLAPGFPDFP
jgi:eukaryotic-like serine/threonine-protein kinase